ncbi:hypothetical protein KZZ52_17915 [Dactylosporangium sp. AC04546]|uniref:hypothetical protein n=1 Tax=Dactylosporangium sp. AC04546 TaxID=2862460 RepID=UPI001EDD5AB8|nr:hypothetical protein [Dactylosporangium sp. AC04546]WVK87177.1 hypothetical protein KZZ52_17915 [Dactylosporangium sp. AC04546]
MRTWFITGGTAGGMAYAEAALEAGDRVVLTARRAEPLDSWAKAHGDRVLVLPLDVTDAPAVRTAPLREPIAAYAPLLERVRATMVDQDGRQPGDPGRGARAVLQAMRQDPPPRRLVLGGDAFEAVTAELEAAMTDIRSSEGLARGADFPVDPV